MNAQGRARLPREREAALAWYFNTLPSRYLHASWRHRFVAVPWRDALFDSPHGHGELSRRILRAIGMEHRFWTDWQTPEAFLALHADSDGMQRLGAWIGQLLLSPHVRRALGKDERLAWRNALGEPRYRFLCRQAPLMVTKEVEPLLVPSEISPGTFGTCAPAVGLHLLVRASERLPETLGARLRLKLPAAHSLPRVQLRDTSFDLEIWPWILRMWHRLQTHTLL